MGSKVNELSEDVRMVKAKIAAMPTVQYGNAGDQGGADGIRAKSEAPASIVPAMPGPMFANAGVSKPVRGRLMSSDRSIGKVAIYACQAGGINLQLLQCS